MKEETREMIKKTFKKVIFDYWTLKVLFGGLIFGYFRILHRSKVKVVGKENIPKKGITLFYCSHPTMMDPIAVIAVGFYPRVIYDPSSMPWGLAAEENFLPDNSRKMPIIKNIPWLRNKPFLKWTLEGVCIPVKRGRKDPRAYKEAVKKMKEGKNVLIFPEGHRTPEEKSLDEFEPGSAGLFLNADISAVIPVLINNDAKKILPKGQDWPDWSKGKITITFGESIASKLEKYKKGRYRINKRKAREKITETMRDELKKL